MSKDIHSTLRSILEKETCELAFVGNIVVLIDEDYTMDFCSFKIVNNQINYHLLPGGNLQDLMQRVDNRDFMTVHTLIQPNLECLEMWIYLHHRGVLKLMDDIFDALEEKLATYEITLNVIDTSHFEVTLIFEMPRMTRLFVNVHFPSPAHHMETSAILEIIYNSLVNKYELFMGTY